MQTNALRALAIAVMLLVVAPGSAQQGGLTAHPSEGLPIGPFLFTPAVELTWEDRDNITFAPDDTLSDVVFLARSRFHLELPVYDSYLRLDYRPQYRSYREFQLTDNWQHFLTLDGAFRFASGLEINGGYGFVAGNLETREVDPGGELVFGERPFDKHQVSLAGNYWLTATDGLSLEANAVTVSHDSGAHELFYDYETASGAVSWLRQVRPTLRLDVRYRYTAFDAEERADSFRDAAGHELTVGATGKLTPVLSADLRIGYGRRELEAGAAALQEDFAGLIASGSVAYDFGHGGRATVRLLRSDYPSAYFEHAYYTATGAGLLYELTRERFFSHLRYELQRNDYDVPDPLLDTVREDEIATWSVGVGYRLDEFLSVRASFTSQERDSFRRFSYDADVLLLGVVVGY